MRSDAILYTGVTSKASQKVDERKKAVKLAKEEKKAQLTPAIELVLSAIKKEKESTTQSLLSTINPSTKEEDTKSIIVSLNLYTQSLDRLEGKIVRIMRGK